MLESKTNRVVDAWLLSQLIETIRFVEQNFENQYNLNLILKRLREFYLNCFCDFYLEASKPVLKTNDDNEINVQENVWNILRAANYYTLLMYHPFIPSITEELWHRLNEVKDNQSSILDNKYPSFNDLAKIKVCLNFKKSNFDSLFKIF